MAIEATIRQATLAGHELELEAIQGLLACSPRQVAAVSAGGTGAARRVARAE